MIAINKAEKEAISERFPNVHIVRTMRQKSKRHRYYCEEHPDVLRFLSRQRCTAAKTREDGDTYQRNRKKA